MFELSGSLKRGGFDNGCRDPFTESMTYATSNSSPTVFFVHSSEASLSTALIDRSVS